MKTNKRKRGRPAKRTTRQLYNDYIKLYTKKANKLLLEGDSPQMHMIPKDLIKGRKKLITFETTFESFKNTLKEKGQRPTNARILDYMVNRQIYAVERRSAITRKKFIEETARSSGESINVTVKDIMRGKFDVDYKAIRELYHKLKRDSDISGKEAGEIISSTVFGSV